MDEQEKQELILFLFDKLNSVLTHLSGGQFGFLLQGIQFEDYLDTFYASSINNNRGFTLKLDHQIRYTGLVGWLGKYFSDGNFMVAPEVLVKGANTLHVGTMLHEIMHGLIGLGHETEFFTLSRREQIELNKQEAEFLGWPVAQPTPITFGFTI